MEKSFLQINNGCHIFYECLRCNSEQSMIVFLGGLTGMANETDNNIYRKGEKDGSNSNR